VNFEERFIGALDGDLGREARFLAGETFGAFQDRVLPVFRALVDSPSWKEMLIVAHGGTNRVILLHALGAGLSSLGRIEQDAGSINVIDVSADGSLLVRLMNYSPYSPLKDGLRATTMERIFLEHLEILEAGLRRPD
jgi:probable phosphoglycerate mutase